MAAAKDTAKVEPPKADANQTDYGKYIVAARQAFGQRNFDAAGKYAAEALKFKPADPEATKIVSDSHAAMTAPKDLAKVEPPNADPNQTDYGKYIVAARQAFAQRNFDAAGKYAAEALNYKPSDPEATKIVSDSHAALAKAEPPKTEPARADANQTGL